MKRDRGSQSRSYGEGEGRSHAAVAIGGFDGVHLGHQRVLATLRKRAAAASLEPVALTFEPLPREFLNAAAAPPRLQSLRDKVETIRALGIARVHALRFDAALAAEPAESFVQRVLVDMLGARVVLVGEGFRFGHGRAGDVALLEAMGLEAVAVPGVRAETDLRGQRAAPTLISSTRVREALARGDLEGAEALLGRRYALTGRVRRGDARGREIGFPTANLVPARPLALADGVYAVMVRGMDGPAHIGAAHWGMRAWLGGTEHRLEVHLLDFDGDLYGQRVEVTFERFIRADLEFDGLDAMRRRIALDMQAVRDTMGG